TTHVHRPLMKTLPLVLAAGLLALLVGCHSNTGVGGATGDASPTVVASNTQLAKELNLADQEDFENAKRGLIAKPSGNVTLADGTVLRSFDSYNFLTGAAPTTVNPSLWRHAQLNANIGLFKVIDGV